MAEKQKSSEESKSKERTSESLRLRFGSFVLETTRIVPVVVSLVVIAASVIAFQGLNQLIERSARIEVSGFEFALAGSEFTDRIAGLEARLTDLEAAIRQIPEEKLVELKLAEFKKKFDELVVDYSNLKGIIVESPERAVSIPLLHKEVEGLDQRIAALTASTTSQINQIYSFSKWFLGLMITLAIGLVTMGFIRGRAGG